MKKSKKIMTIALASMFMLALCIIPVFAGTTTTYNGNGCSGTGAIYPEAGKGAKGTTTNYTSLGDASCAVQVFAILVGGSGIQKAGNSDVGYAEATGYFADVYNNLDHAEADHHFGINGVYYGVRSTTLPKGSIVNNVSETE